MAELIEEQKTVNEIKQVKHSRSGLWFGLIILLIIAALSGIGYTFLTQLRVM